MKIGRVIDSIWCTRKEEELQGLKFLKVKIQNHEKPSEKDTIIIATDLIGAGIGEKVLLTNGSAARRSAGLEKSPIDCIIIGIIDEKTECEENEND